MRDGCAILFSGLVMLVGCTVYLFLDRPQPGRKRRVIQPPPVVERWRCLFSWREW